MQKPIIGVFFVSETALLIVDMVRDFTDPDGKVFYPQNRQIIPNIRRLLEAFRRRDKVVIFMQHRYRKNKPERNLKMMRPCCIEGTAGVEIDAELTPLDTEYVIPKRRYSAFFGTDLDLVLRENGVRNIVIVGTKTNCCINATALDGSYREYGIYVVSDCVGTDDEVTNAAYLRDIGKYIGSVAESDEIIHQLDRGEL